MLITEKDIEKLILSKLNQVKEGFVCSIEISGKPIKTSMGFRMIPFNSRFHRKGMSDILFFLKGKFFAFEVKTPREHKWVKNKIPQLNNKITLSKKETHLAEQLFFINKINETGGYADFVSTCEEVMAIINKAFQNDSK